MCCSKDSQACANIPTNGPWKLTIEKEWILDFLLLFPPGLPPSRGDSLHRCKCFAKPCQNTEQCRALFWCYVFFGLEKIRSRPLHFGHLHKKRISLLVWCGLYMVCCYRRILAHTRQMSPTVSTWTFPQRDTVLRIYIGGLIVGGQTALFQSPMHFQELWSCISSQVPTIQFASILPLGYFGTRDFCNSWYFSFDKRSPCWTVLMLLYSF